MTSKRFKLKRGKFHGEWDVIVNGKPFATVVKLVYSGGRWHAFTIGRDLPRADVIAKTRRASIEGVLAAVKAAKGGPS